MNTVSVKLPLALALELAAAAKKQGLSRSEFIRAAIRERLAHLQESKKGSVVDVAGDLVGCLDGPSDLSTNKKYLRGFGQ